MSDLPEPAVSAELKAWLYNVNTESIPKALAAFPRADSPSPYGDNYPAVRLRGFSRFRTVEGDSDTAVKGKTPAKHRRVSYSKSREVVSQHDFDPIEGSTSNYNLQVVDEYYAEHSDNYAPPHKTS
ncbi:Hypothetical predicted protein [Pelobates cultripes]|uniref:Uncharacterized protein n=1 Tax=Pelobates cultripes TaxID=61616 RepID=A0AAD1SL77_PELCU|nr:Hypothetical predicted protein [Pelobates cultripes]